MGKQLGGQDHSPGIKGYMLVGGRIKLKKMARLLKYDRSGLEM